MRIGVDARMLGSSGIGKVIENILKRMIPQCPEWNFFIIINKKEYSRYSFLISHNVSCIYCSTPIYSIKEQFALWKKIPMNLDVFWSPHYNIPLFYKGNLVVTIHDLAHLALKQNKYEYLKKLYARIMLKNAIKKASSIVCVSKFTINELKRFFQNVNMDKINLIYNGVDEEWYNIKCGAKLRNNPYYVFVGNVKPHKNLVRLIEAYKLVCNEIKEDLLIIGKKEGFINGIDNISELIKGYENRIVFTGYVDDTMLKQYVIQSEGMIFPSLYEGFGLPPMECIAAGVPVFCSNIPVLREIYKNNVIYFDPYDVNDIARCIKNKTIISVDNSCPTWDCAVKNMIDIFNQYNIR